MRWLYKLENKMKGRHIQRLMGVIVFPMIVVYLLQNLIPGISLYNFFGTGILDFNRTLILKGQVWRLITFVFVPSGGNAFWVLFSCYIYYSLGTSLENYWGGFRFNVYYFCGVIGAIITGFITGYASNAYLNSSLFLAYATIAPNSEFLLFFYFPIKAKLMAFAYAIVTAIELIRIFMVSPLFGLYSLLLLAFSLLGYLLFFGNTLYKEVKEAIRVYKNRRNWRHRK